MYVRSQTNTQLLLASEALAAEIGSYSIAREGQCTGCTLSSSGYYNGDCSSATNSPGSQRLCKTFAPEACNPDEYLYHESTLGCQQTQARTDYECKQCPLVWINAGVTKYKVFIVVGCGVGATSFMRWHPHQNEQIGGVERPKSFECSYNLPASDEDFTKCIHRGQPHALRNPDTQRFWSSAGEEPGTALLPYCRTYWLVDTKTYSECSLPELLTASEYRPQCCKQCQSSIPGFMKGTEYEDCPGSSTEDLQKWVPSCPSGQYKVDAADADAGAGSGSGTDTDTGEGDQCVPCTVCGS